MPLSSVITNLYQAQLDLDWQAMIKHESYMKDLMADRDDGICQEIIRMFPAAHDAMLERTGESRYQFATIELIKWCVELHRKMREFSTQDRLLVNLAMHCIMIPDIKEVKTAAMK